MNHHGWLLIAGVGRPATAVVAGLLLLLPALADDDVVAPDAARLGALAGAGPARVEGSLGSVELALSESWEEPPGSFARPSHLAATSCPSSFCAELVYREMPPAYSRFPRGAYGLLLTGEARPLQGQSHQEPEAYFSSRTAAFPPYTQATFHVPYLRSGQSLPLTADVTALERLTTWLRTDPGPDPAA